MGKKNIDEKARGVIVSKNTSCFRWHSFHYVGSPEMMAEFGHSSLFDHCLRSSFSSKALVSELVRKLQFTAAYESLQNVIVQVLLLSLGATTSGDPPSL